MVFICLQRWQTQGHVDPGLMDTLWSAVALASQVFDLTFFVFFSATDSALDDFVLMHCVFIPNSQLCPVLLAQYPFAAVPCSFTSLWNRSELKLQSKPSLFCAMLTSFGSLTFRAPTMPRPREAVSRRRWTIRWTTSGGWSAWWCSGLLYTGITCRRRKSL